MPKAIREYRRETETSEWRLEAIWYLIEDPQAGTGLSLKARLPSLKRIWDEAAGEALAEGFTPEVVFYQLADGGNGYTVRRGDPEEVSQEELDAFGDEE